MNRFDRGKLTTAQEAHYKARIFVLNKKLSEAQDVETFQEIVRELDCVEHHLECFENRNQISHYLTAPNNGLKRKWDNASREVFYGKVSQTTFSKKR